jgi:hypothetical protein
MTHAASHTVITDIKIEGAAVPPPILRVNADGKFKILQIEDTHMVTEVSICGTI